MATSISIYPARRRRLTYRKLWNLLQPFHRHYSQYVAGVFFRQMLIVLGGYSMVWALRLAKGHLGVPEWAFVIALVVYDTGLLSFDVTLNTLFASRLSYPLFGYLRTNALEKVFQMPLEWHHRQSAGTLVGKVNNGVGRVV
ncbi:MAG: transporter related, partial [Bryobacterales bacterium]|nr:transporter related [Bryobacterales bacterium]